MLLVRVPNDLLSAETSAFYIPGLLVSRFSPLTVQSKSFSHLVSHILLFLAQIACLSLERLIMLSFASHLLTRF